MGKFSTDRCMREYAEKIWQIEPCERPPPDEVLRIRSFANEGPKGMCDSPPPSAASPSRVGEPSGKKGKGHKDKKELVVGS